MISLFQAIIVFVLLGLGTFYYFKTRSSPETPKSDDFDPLEDVEAEPDIKPAKPSPAVADEPDIDLEPEVIVTPAKPENEDEPVKPTPTTTPSKPIVPEKPKPTLKPVVTNGKRVLTNEEVDVFLGKIQKSMVKAGQCQADAFKKAFRTILKDKQFDKETIAKMLDPNRSRFFPMDAPGAKVYDGFIPNDVLPEYQKIFMTQIRYALEKCQKERENRPITKPAVVKPAVEPEEPKQPTPTKTPAKPLVPTRPAPKPVKRKLTKEELGLFISKIRKFFESRSGECQAIMYAKLFTDITINAQFDNNTIALMLDPSRTSFSSTEVKGGFIPVVVLKGFGQFYASGGQREIMQRCARR